MPNATLDRFRAERDHQLAFVDEMLARAAADDRDLVDAEVANLTATRERIGQLDAQIGPLEEFEALRGQHQSAIASIIGPRGDAQRPLGGGDPRVSWASPGAFLADYIASRGLITNRSGQRLPADPEAMSRVQYALQNQTTTDTPGLMPSPIVGTVVSLIDANRPFITSVGGGRSMGGIPGKTFGRPKITQHVQVGVQTAEKTELPSRKMTIGEIPFAKATYGGAVDVSRQDIDWSSPAAWDILIRDLADVYAQETELAAATDALAKADDINAATVVGGDSLSDWATALYAAAGLVYASAKRLPDRVWCSVDVWGLLGPLTDVAVTNRPIGTSDLSSFAGNLFTLPRIVVPSWPAGSCVIGSSSAYEVYEEVIGLLTAVEPSLLGVEVAYGGYIAFNAVVPEALAPITPPAVIPLGTRSSTKA